MEPVLHLPHEDYRRDLQLKKAFGFRTKVNGDDLIDYASLVSGSPELAGGFEECLSKMDRLLSPPVIKKLSRIPFILNSNGRLSQPTETYLPTELNRSCLGQETPFVASDQIGLYKKLGCPSTPSSKDILSHIRALRERNCHPRKPDVMYTTLVQTLKKEGVASNSHSSERILWVNDGFFAPIEVLIGANHRKIFLDAVPQIDVLAVSSQRSAESLGGHAQPKSHHWKKLFSWYGERYKFSRESVKQTERTSLREAYGRLSSVPEGVSHEWRFLLDRRGKLHSLREANEGRYVIDDDPHLAEAVAEQNLPIAFADTTAVGSLKFFVEAGVKTLTTVATRERAVPGNPVPTPARLDVDGVLRKLHSQDFASAVAALAEYEMRTHPDSQAAPPLVIADTLNAVHNVEFVDELKINYRVADCSVDVREEAILQNNTVVCVEIANMSELKGIICGVVARSLADDVSVQRSLADSMYRLLDGSSASEMERYIRGRGIPWSPVSKPRNDDGGNGLSTEFFEQHEDGVEEYVRGMLAEDLTRKSSVLDDVQHVSDTEAGSNSSNLKTVGGTERSGKLQLPPIEQVNSQIIGGGGAFRTRQNSDERIKRRPRPWTPPSPVQAERDRLVGRRGEEIVYRHEVDKAKSLGFDESRVVWVSERDPGADHDIQSVDEDGKSIWVEVKSSTGRDGRFHWTKAEFDRARRHRDRYVLYRVYKATSRAPSVKVFRDPVKLLLNNAMRLNVNTLNAEVEPLGPSAGI